MSGQTNPPHYQYGRCGNGSFLKIECTFSCAHAVSILQLTENTNHCKRSLQTNMFPDHAYQKVVLPLYTKSKGYEPSLKVKRLTQELLCPCLLSEMSLPHLSKWRFLRQIYPLQVEVVISEVRRCSSSFSEQLNFPVNSHAQMPLH